MGCVQIQTILRVSLTILIIKGIVQILFFLLLQTFHNNLIKLYCICVVLDLNFIFTRYCIKLTKILAEKKTDKLLNYFIL